MKHRLCFMRYDWLELLLLPTLKFELMGAITTSYWCLVYLFQLLLTIILKPRSQPYATFKMRLVAVQVLESIARDFDLLQFLVVAGSWT